jgi:hypothetical protein
MQTNSGRILCFVTALTLAGCAQNTKTLLALDPHTQRMTWKAPEQITRNFRLLFYGYDTLYYRLTAAYADPQGEQLIYSLVIEAHYGGAPRNYQQIKLDDKQIIGNSTLDHDVERCQIFGNMTSSCLYRDKAAFVLAQSLLESHRQSGLKLTLATADKDYETVELTPQYIDQFLSTITAK